MLLQPGSMAGMGANSKWEFRVKTLAPGIRANSQRFQMPDGGGGGKWKNTPRQKIGTSSLTACSQMLTACSQHAHKWYQTLQTSVKWPKNTLTRLGRSQHAHSMVLERSFSFKFIQIHSKSRQFPPSVARLVFDWLSFFYKIQPIKFIL